MQKKETQSSFRRKTQTVVIGQVPLGSDFPVRIQSMTNTLTSDIDSTVEQCIRIIKAGADYVRITVPSLSDAENLPKIKDKLRSMGYATPLIADVHFNAEIAYRVAEFVEKVRINPGNYGVKVNLHKSDYTREEYDEELNNQRTIFVRLLKKCRVYKTAIRIGVNHGSLSGRIMSKLGDTPEGMVESALEFLRICRDENFTSVVVSLKASNTLIMVHATRLLVAKMQEENMQFPMHLGVTEAGEGEDGRIKSAIGIGTLLADGIGDTIRVSLTEDPEAEIPVAQKLVKYCTGLNNENKFRDFAAFFYNPVTYSRRKSITVKNAGGNGVPLVIADIQCISDNMDNLNRNRETSWIINPEASPDYLYCSEWKDHYHAPQGKGIIIPSGIWNTLKANKDVFPLFAGTGILKASSLAAEIIFLELTLADLNDEMLHFIRARVNIILIAANDSFSVIAEFRLFFEKLFQHKITAPVVLKKEYSEKGKENFQLQAAVHLGGLLIDGMGDGIWLSEKGHLKAGDMCSTSFAILQATRTRISRTDYIACPSCGRTHFNLMDTLAGIKAKTSHLKGLKIGIMGCIVNGPGEMADADYGYVGSGKGKVTLYKAKEVIKSNIPEESAVDELIRLIKENGDWKEKDELQI
jgi:(E)-4-hydroxy-3-methylbut-2-enyl-diphosphate synthase